MARWKERPRTVAKPKRRATREILVALGSGVAVVRTGEPQQLDGVSLPVLVSLDPFISVEEAAAALRLAADELDEPADDR